MNVGSIEYSRGMHRDPLPSPPRVITKVFLGGEGNEGHAGASPRKARSLGLRAWAWAV